jgi:hypothetical protein
MGSKVPPFAFQAAEGKQGSEVQGSEFKVQGSRFRVHRFMGS